MGGERSPSAAWAPGRVALGVRMRRQHIWDCTDRHYHDTRKFCITTSSIEDNNSELGPLKIMSSTGIRYLSVYLLVVFSFESCVSGYMDCSSENDCNYGYSCCGGQCVVSTNCKGYSCSDDSDCSYLDTCCDGTCSDSDESCFTTDYGAVVGIIIGSAIFVCLLSLCCYYCARYRPRQRYRGRLIVERRVTTTTVATRCATQSNTPYQYQGQVPPPYQQSYPYNPPPQYVQYPPYNAGSANEPPPPYSIAPEGRPGGVYTPQSNYGALSTPSAPHLEQ